MRLHKIHPTAMKFQKPTSRYRVDSDPHIWPWWTVRVQKNSVIHKLLSALADRPLRSKEAERHHDLRQTSVIRAIHYGLVERKGDTLHITEDGKKIHTALQIGIPPQSLLILGVIYAKMYFVGFYIRLPEQYMHVNISQDQVKYGFRHLSDKKLIRRINIPKIWYIPQDNMRRLGPYHEILLNISEQILY